MILSIARSFVALVLVGSALANPAAALDRGGAGLAIEASSTVGRPPTCAHGSTCGISEMRADADGQFVRILATRPNDILNVKEFGAIGDGQSHPLSARFATMPAAQSLYPAALALTDEIDWAAAQAAANRACALGGGLLVYPQGSYVQNRTVSVACDSTVVEGVAENAVKILRFKDFGPTFRFAKASGYLRGVGLRRLWLVDANASMTVSKSPFHISADGLTRSTFADINVSEGSGALDLAGGDQIVVRNLYGSFTRGAPAARVGVRIGPSSNSALGALPVGISDVWFHHVNIKGGEPNAADDGWHLTFGIQALAADGLWISDSHVQGTATANWHFRRSTTAPLGNVYAANVMSDLCNMYGILIDGPYILQRTSIDGWVSGGQAAGDKSAGGHGIYVTGAGGSSDLTLRIGVDGHKLDGIRVDAPKVTATTILPKQIRALGGARSIAINLLSDARFSIAGGIVDSDAAIGTGLHLQGVADASVTGLSITGVLGNGLQIGSTASYISVVGGQSSRNRGYGATVASGANFVSIFGMPVVNNGASSSTGIQNNMSAHSAAEINSNLGQ